MYVYEINKEYKAMSYLLDNGLIFVSRYKSSHSSARKILRKMLKESKVSMVNQCRDGFTYKLNKGTGS